jgi:hypothetical protein
MKTFPLAALATLLFATNAHAGVTVRLPWEKPRHERRAPAPTYERNDPYYGDRYATSEDVYFLQRMHASLQEEMALADAVRHENRIPEVRRFAERTLAETSAFDDDLRRRAADLGVRLDAPRFDTRFAGRMGDGEMAIEWLRTSMDIVKRDRFYWSEFKKQESDRRFHDTLQHHWNDMVDRRDDAKDLHDRIRNSERRRYHGS